MIELLKETVEIADQPGYFIHPSGRVFKVQEMAYWDNGSGYLYSRISGGRRSISVHREVAKAFVGNPTGAVTVDHIDGNKRNNHKDNLQWLSLADNIRKSHARQVVFEHRDGRVAKTSNIRRFAREYGLDSSAVSKVVKGKLNHTGGWSLMKDG